MSKTTGIGESASAEGPLLRLNDREWFSRLGQVAQAIGSRAFHHELVDLFGASIRHESCWIIRFSRAAQPEVLFTRDVPDEVVGTYRTDYSDIDPFSEYWKYNSHAGVITLSDAEAQSHRSDAYRKVFLPRANISDEMSIFLPTVGQDCYGLFLEREHGQFSRADVERARLVFPALDGCHRAHLGWLFANVHKISELECHGLANKPILIQDRLGCEVYSNDAWNEAVAADRGIYSQLNTLPARGEKTGMLDRWVLKFETLRSDFPLAPHGRMFVLEPHLASPGGAGDASFDCSASAFTPRERDIFTMIMNGCTTGQIAQTLKISKGVIKNYKLRIYRKTSVDSERALVRKFAPSILNWNENVKKNEAAHAAPVGPARER